MKCDGEAADGFDAIDVCRQMKPDVVLMDIKMPLLDGLSAARIMSSEGIELPSFFSPRTVSGNL